MKIYLYAVLLIFGLVSCANNNDDETYKEQEKPTKTLASYQGVWEKTNNDTAFVAISQTGFVSYYFSDGMMGQGQGMLANDTIFVQNERTGLQDNIIIRENTNDVISLTGRIASTHWTGAYSYSDGSFRKTNEGTVSFAGDVWIPDLWFGSTASYTWSQWRIQVTSNNSALHFRYHKTDGITKQEGLYCLQRYYKNRVKFLYSRFTNSDSYEVVIFSFDPNETEKVIRNNKGLIYL